jgi:hypothetical protein
MTVGTFNGQRCALVVGHPGHELRVWGWMRAVTPAVAVLTDGSGHEGRSRLQLSREICAGAGALPGDLFGLVTDAAIYQAVLSGDAAFFLSLADRLAVWLVREQITVVVGDAIEGYNPTHDLCRILVNRAVRVASKTHPLTTYAFDLTGPPGLPANGPAVTISLPPGDMALKIATCRSYGDQVGGTLLTEIDGLLEQHGEGMFACEYLIPVDAWQDVAAAAGYRPYYETYGERQVAAGHYRNVIRYDAHVRPLIHALQQ